MSPSSGGGGFVTASGGREGSGALLCAAGGAAAAGTAGLAGAADVGIAAGFFGEALPPPFAGPLPRRGGG